MSTAVHINEVRAIREVGCLDSCEDAVLSIPQVHEKQYLHFSSCRGDGVIYFGLHRVSSFDNL